jgi:hypothetical protein
METIYHYDAGTGELLGSGPADICNVTGEAIIPAYATDIVPPVAGANQVAVFVNGAWSLQPDFRGQTFYSTSTGAPVQIAAIGPLPVNLTNLTPGPNTTWSGTAWVFDTATAMAQIRAQRNALLATCDWTQLPDVPMATALKTSWQTYRQALRDFPATCVPSAPVWPTPPAA